MQAEASRGCVAIAQNVDEHQSNWSVDAAVSHPCPAMHAITFITGVANEGKGFRVLAPNSSGFHQRRAIIRNIC